MSITCQSRTTAPATNLTTSENGITHTDISCDVLQVEVVFWNCVCTMRVKKHNSKVHSNTISPITLAAGNDVLLTPFLQSSFGLKVFAPKATS